MYQSRYHYITKEHLDFNDIKMKLKNYYDKEKISVSNNKLNRDTESSLFIISSILYRIYVYKDKKTDFNKYISLYSKILKTVIGKHYKIILNFLIYEKIIQVKLNSYNKEIYSSGYFSKSYKLNSNYLKYKTITSQYFYLKSIDKSIEKEYIKLNPLYKHLHSFLNKLKLDDNYKWLNKHKPQIAIFNSYENSAILKIDKSGRNYHKLTNIFSFARHFITYENKNLCSIDCTNSQPLLLYMLHKTNLRTNFKQETEDSKLYGKYVTDGNLYEYLLIHYNANNKTQINRKEIKVLLYKYVLFNYKQFKNPLLTIFKEKFPSIYETIKINQRFKDDLSYTLRHIEADIWINQIAKKIYETNKNIPIFVLHDAIFTTEEYLNTINNIIIDIFKNQIILQPSLHIKKYGKNSKSFAIDEYEYLK